MYINITGHTAQEIPSTSAILSTAAILWEKLAPNGILVMVEPGTPDGFQSIRAVREMLLDCCPPTSHTSSKHKDEDEYDYENNNDNLWAREEAHVIAPCTHNGSCPMGRPEEMFPRHMTSAQLQQQFQLQQQRQQQQSKGNQLLEYDIEYDSDDEGNDNDNNGDDDDDFDWDQWGQEGQYKSSSRLSKTKSNTSSTFKSSPNDENEYLNVEQIHQMETDQRRQIQETEKFSQAFCSFVHALPSQDVSRSQWTKKKGEKFSYIVLQKRIVGGGSNPHSNPSLSNPTKNEEKSHSNTNIVNLLAESMDVSLHLHSSEFNETNQNYTKTTTEDEDLQRYEQLLREAVALEQSILDSNEKNDADYDELGLEHVRASSYYNSNNTPSHSNSIQNLPWGRLVRAPIKRKGHVAVDYCTGGSSITTTTVDGDEQQQQQQQQKQQGRIVRHMVTKGKSAKVAPGLYAAARKARWGGLWPDLSAAATPSVIATTTTTTTTGSGQHLYDFSHEQDNLNSLTPTKEEEDFLNDLKGLMEDDCEEQEGQDIDKDPK